MPQAQWSIDKRQVTASTDADGTQHWSVPLLDDGVKAGTLVGRITPDRELLLEWHAEPGVEPLADFRAWLKEA
jgi:hypothetical protein